MWNEESKEVLANQPGWVSDDLREGLKKRSKVKVMEEDAKSLKSAANDLIGPALDIIGAVAVTDDKIGTVRNKPGKNISYNTDKIAQSLLEAGVGAQTIKEAIESYIEVGLRTQLFKDASQFEVREVTPNRVEISTARCPYVHVCKDLLDQGSSLGALTCARLGCFNAAVKLLSGIETTYEVLGVHLLAGCEGVIERK